MQVLYDAKPSVLEAVGNGSYLYRWNIKEIEQPAQDERAESVTQWECQETLIWGPISSNKITEAVIGDLWDCNYEQKLVNEYNAAKLGVYDKATSDKKIEAYTVFLVERNAIKEQVDTDCEELGIK